MKENVLTDYNASMKSVCVTDMLIVQINQMKIQTFVEVIVLFTQLYNLSCEVECVIYFYYSWFTSK